VHNPTQSEKRKQKMKGERINHPQIKSNGVVH